MSPHDYTPTFFPIAFLPPIWKFTAALPYNNNSLDHSLPDFSTFGNLSCSPVHAKKITSPFWKITISFLDHRMCCLSCLRMRRYSMHQPGLHNLLPGHCSTVILIILIIKQRQQEKQIYSFKRFVYFVMYEWAWHYLYTTGFHCLLNKINNKKKKKTIMWMQCNELPSLFLQCPLGLRGLEAPSYC